MAQFLIHCIVHTYYLHIPGLPQLNYRLRFANTIPIKYYSLLCFDIITHEYCSEHISHSPLSHEGPALAVSIKQAVPNQMLHMHLGGGGDFLSKHHYDLILGHAQEILMSNAQPMCHKVHIHYHNLNK